MFYVCAQAERCLPSTALMCRFSRTLDEKLMSISQMLSTAEFNDTDYTRSNDDVMSHLDGAKSLYLHNNTHMVE